MLSLVADQVHYNFDYRYNFTGFLFKTSYSILNLHYIQLLLHVPSITGCLCGRQRRHNRALLTSQASYFCQYFIFKWIQEGLYVYEDGIQIIVTMVIEIISDPDNE